MGIVRYWFTLQIIGKETAKDAIFCHILAQLIIRIITCAWYENGRALSLSFLTLSLSLYLSIYRYLSLPISFSLSLFLFVSCSFSLSLSFSFIINQLYTYIVFIYSLFTY